MSGRHLLAAILGLSLVAVASPALDLTTIDRTIGKEPVYESKEPQYCLLVFGPEAKVRVWLVLDGDVLYVDRNGNGDLTDPGDRMLARSALHHPEDRPEIEILQSFIFFTGTTKAGKEIKGPILSCTPEVTWFLVDQLLPRSEFRDDPHRASYWKRPFRVAVANAAGWEQDASLAFASRPQDAPILHFLGPQQVTWDKRQSLEIRRGETAEFLVGLTTPGIDAAVRTYEGIPKTAHAVADIELPPRQPGGLPICRHVELKDPGG
jgi:hypothetical protein